MYLNNENKISKQNKRNRNIVQYKHTPATIRELGNLSQINLQNNLY